MLLEAGLFFPWVGGISAGCTNTVNMVSRDLWRTREAFVGLTTDPEAGGWGSFIRRRGYFNSDHIYRHTSAPGELFPFDWPTFKATSATVRIGSFRCDTGEEVYWGLGDMDELEDLLPRCQASSWAVRRTTAVVRTRPGTGASTEAAPGMSVSMEGSAAARSISKPRASRRGYSPE